MFSHKRYLPYQCAFLFELGLLVARFYQPKDDEEETTDEESAVENQADLNHKD